MIEKIENKAVEKQEWHLPEISLPKKEESISIVEYVQTQMKTFAKYAAAANRNFTHILLPHN